MRGGDGVGLAQREFVKFGRDHADVHAFRLVHREQHPPAGLAQHAGNVAVLWRESLAHVDHEQDHVGLGDGLQGLLRHLVQNALFRHRLETPGVDHEIGPVSHPAFTVMAIARQSGHVRDQRIAAAREPVEQRGFADVRPADDDYGRFHTCGIGRKGAKDAKKSTFLAPFAPWR